MEGRGALVAVERNPRRAGALVRTAERLRAGNVRVEVGDAARWPFSEGPEGHAAFDRVLVDPPCSGLGTLQARADLRWRVTPEAIAEMAGEQARILAAAASALRPGGVLVYSTCTIFPTENERLIDAFLDSHRDFTADDLGSELPAFSMAQALPEGEARWRAYALTLPHRDHTAGFFIARLRRS
jgi:16S rRNA (cytosine967-C5)-methyltransferase